MDASCFASLLRSSRPKQALVVRFCSSAIFRLGPSIAVCSHAVRRIPLLPFPVSWELDFVGAREPSRTYPRTARTARISPICTSRRWSTRPPPGFGRGACNSTTALWFQTPRAAAPLPGIAATVHRLQGPGQAVSLRAAPDITQTLTTPQSATIGACCRWSSAPRSSHWRRRSPTASCIQRPPNLRWTRSPPCDCPLTVSLRLFPAQDVLTLATRTLLITADD